MANNFTADNHFQRTGLVTLWTDNTFHSILNMACTDDVETSQSPTVLFTTTLIQTTTLDEVLVLLGLKRLQSLES